MRNRRTVVVAAMCTGALLVAAVALLLFRPALILGVDSSTLSCSVDCNSAPPCVHLVGGAWACYRTNGSGDLVRYRVTVNGLGCWHAARTEPDSEGSPAEVDGCISLFDYTD